VARSKDVSKDWVETCSTTSAALLVGAHSTRPAEASTATFVHPPLGPPPAATGGNAMRCAGA
jgi:hypothetical protein